MSRDRAVIRSVVPLRWIGCIRRVASSAVAGRRLALPAGASADAIR